MIRRITELTPELIEQVKSLGQQFYDLSRADAEFDPGWFMAIWNKALESGVATMWGYFTPDNKLAGMLGAMLHPCLFSGLTVATEAFWYVRADHRGGPSGVKLFLEFIKWAGEVGAGRVQSAHINTSMTVELASFYAKQGFKPLETIYIKEVE